MPQKINSRENDDSGTRVVPGRSGKRRSRSGHALAVALALFSVCCAMRSQTPTPTPETNKQTAAADNKLVPATNDPNTAQNTQPEQNKADSADIARKREITDDSAKLLKLASDLKAEVDKTNKDTLSLSVIRKADEIEKLAHNVREKMRVNSGPN